MKGANLLEKDSLNMEGPNLLGKDSQNIEKITAKFRFYTFTRCTSDNVHQVAAGGVVAHGGWGSLASAGKTAVYMPPLLCSLTVCSSAVRPGSHRDYHVSESHGL